MEVKGKRLSTEPGGRECNRSPVCSLLGAVVFECCWWITGGGYYCSVPIFLALFCYCYGKEMLCPAILHELARNIKTNVTVLCREEKRSVLLILSYFATKIVLTVAYPKGEESNGTPLSLVMFTVIFICIFLAPYLLRIISSLLALLIRMVISVFYSAEISPSSRQEHWKPDLKFYHKVISTWKRSLSLLWALTYLTAI